MEKLKAVLRHPFFAYWALRLRERSTWRGIAAIAATFGIVVAPDAVDLIYTTVIGLCSLWAIAEEGRLVKLEPPEAPEDGEEHS